MNRTAWYLNTLILGSNRLPTQMRLGVSSLQCEAVGHWRSWLWWRIICKKLRSNPGVTKLDSCTWPSLTPTTVANAWLVGRIHSFHSIYSRKQLDSALTLKHCIITTFPQNAEKEMVLYKSLKSKQLPQWFTIVHIAAKSKVWWSVRASFRVA